MAAIFSGILATFVTLPIIGYLIVFISTKQITRNHGKSVRAGLNVMTFFCMLSVHFLVLTIWDTSLLWLILMTIIILGMLVVIVHHRLKGEIDISRVWKGFWRLNGLVFILAHCLLVIYGVFVSVLHIF